MAQGRAATIEELEQVRTEMQRLIIRSEVVSQDTFRLTTQLAELMEMTERRFDLVDERFARLVVAIADQIAASEQRMMRYVNETVAEQIAASEQRMMRYVDERIAASEQRMMTHVSEQIAASEQRIINAILGLTAAKN